MKYMHRTILLAVVLLIVSCKGTTDSGSGGSDANNNENSSGNITPPEQVTPPDQVIAPVFSFANGEVDFTIPITLESETEDATIYYTINSDDPTLSSESGKSIDISSYSGSVTIKAMAVKNGMTNSTVTSAVYTQPTVASPRFSRESGKVLLGKTTLTVEVDTVGATIKYAIGSDEPINGTVYDSGIELDFTTDGEKQIVRVIAVKDGCKNSNITEIELTANAMKMHPIASGTFKMGSSGEVDANESPIREIKLSSFIIGTYEVTQWQWESVMGAWPQTDPADTKYGSTDNHPAYNISWYDAVEFCNALSKQEGLTPYYTINSTPGSDPNNKQGEDTKKWLVTLNKEANGYRLPTEAEWEFAAAGGGNEHRTMYAGTDNGEPTGNNPLTSYAWYSENSNGKTHEVGTAGNANSLGLYDMNGNVWEWCWDWFKPYIVEDNNNPTGATSGSARTARGGAWDSESVRLRVVERGDAGPHKSFATIGFRVARNVSPEEGMTINN